MTDRLAGNADVRQRTERVVRGALQACIHDHGPITQVNVDSAVKRVIGGFLALAAEGSNLLGVGDEHTDCRIQAEALEKRLRKLRHGHERLLAQHAELQRRNADPEVVLRELGFERVGSRCDDGSIANHVGTINGHDRPVYGKPV